MIQFAKLFISSAALLLLAVSASAQIGVGFNVGYISSDFRFDDEGANAQVLRSDRVDGYVIGGFIEHVVSRKFGLQAEINFKRTGSDRTHLVILDETRSVEETINRRFNYVEVPVLVKYRMPFKGFTVSAMAGPSFSYARNADGITDSNLFIDGNEFMMEGEEFEIEFDEEMIRRIDFGGQLGLQVGISLKVGKLILDGRYRRGFTNMNDGINENRFGGLEDFESTTQSASFTIGYMRTFGKNKAVQDYNKDI
jgi:hypothetical protein